MILAFQQHKRRKISLLLDTKFVPLPIQGEVGDVAGTLTPSRGASLTVETPGFEIQGTSLVLTAPLTQTSVVIRADKRGFLTNHTTIQVDSELVLSSNTINQGAVPDTVIGTFSKDTSLTNDATGRFRLEGRDLVVNSSLSGDGGASYTITAGGQNFQITVTKVTLQQLTGSFSLPEDASTNDVAGTIGNNASGSSIEILGNLDLNGLNVIKGTQALDFEAATSIVFTARESHPDADAPNDTIFSLAVTNVNEVALNALTLSTNSIPIGEAVTINILGVTAGSTITGSVPSGMTLNSGARTITGTPDTAQNNTISLTESADDATDRVSNVALNIESPARTILNTLANSDVPGEDIEGFVEQANALNDILNDIEGGNVVIDFTQSASSIVAALDARITAIEATDVDPPVLAQPSAEQTGETTGDLIVFTDEIGGTLYVVITETATTPTAQQVEGGEDHASVAAIAISQGVNTLGVQAVGASLLTAETGYYAHFMHKDAAGNRSDVVSSAQFTTAGGATVDNTLANSTLAINQVTGMVDLVNALDTRFTALEAA